MITTFLSNVKSNIFPKWQKIRDNMSVIPDPYLFLEMADHIVAELVHVPDYAVVAVVEDGGVRVLIDGDELARVDAVTWFTAPEMPKPI